MCVWERDDLRKSLPGASSFTLPTPTGLSLSLWARPARVLESWVGRPHPGWCFSIWGESLALVSYHIRWAPVKETLKEAALWPLVTSELWWGATRSSPTLPMSLEHVWSLPLHLGRWGISRTLFFLFPSPFKQPLTPAFYFWSLSILGAKPTATKEIIKNLSLHV